MDYEKKFAEQVRLLGLEADLAAFAEYGRQILFWNRIAGITSHRTAEEIYEYMFLDSLYGFRVKELLEGKKVGDFGTGGGFPGVPLKMILPAMSLHLIDSSRKRCDFLEKLVRHLGLDGVTVLCERGEELAEKTDFDVVVSRACAELFRLLEWTLPLVRPGGRLVLWKGPLWREELRRARNVMESSGAALESFYEYELPSEGRKRTLLVLSAPDRPPA